MKTYLAINLTNKKFQVGSSIHPEVRVKQHIKNKEETPFHRSLRRNPDNFYWIIGADDGLGNDDRSDEQFYLDFYHGSQWCYNINQFATRGPDRTGQKQPEGWGEAHGDKLRGRKRPDQSERMKNNPPSRMPGVAEKISAAMTGHDVPQDVRDKISVTLTGTSWGTHTDEHREMMSERYQGEGNPAYGRKWWVNKLGERLYQTECPGEGWQNGMRWKG
jgi:hypothetical protein